MIEKVLVAGPVHRDDIHDVAHDDALGDLFSVFERCRDGNFLECIEFRK